MNTKALLRLACSLFVISLMITSAARAQSAFSNAVISLNPVAYWPLQETVQPPIADVETNLGSLGAAANAYYSSTNVIKGQTPIPGDSGDPTAFAVACSATANGSFLAVPTTGGASTLPAGPFSVEVWVNATNITLPATIIAQTGPSSGPAGTGGLNGGANSAGWSLNVGYVPSSLDTNIPSTVSFHVYNGNGVTGGAEAIFTSTSFSINTWYHIVGTFDGTNAQVEVNAVAGTVVQPMTGTQALDTWDELTIGCGRGLNNNKFGGSIDEVAIYTNALSSTQILNHFNAGNGGGNYMQTITNDNPYMYWRMNNAATHTTPSFTAYPTAFNYGSGVNINGLYLPGSTPGVAGPSFPGIGSPSFACAINGIGTDDSNSIPVFTNGVSYATNTVAETGVVITNLLSSMNLTTNNKSFMCWFKGNPSANHRGGFVGHGDSGWRTSMNGGNATANTVGRGGDLSSSPLVYNDGNWHFLAATYFNSGLTNTNGWLATNYLYVDGLQVANAFDPTNSPGSFTNVAIGCPPDHVRTGNGNTYDNQIWPGSVAHVAYFTNALTAAQVINLYTNATGAAAPGPIITIQPTTGRTNGAGTGSGSGSFIFFGVVYNATTMQPSPALQWYYSSSSNYAGANALPTDNVKYFATTNVGNVNSTSAQMTITNLADSDSGYYFVVLNNGFGSTTSILASLTVKTEPFIISQTPPAGTLQLYQNQNFTLSITAGGTNLAFQWYTNGVADNTAGTTASYPLANVQTSMSGNTYFCVASNGGGTATSGTVTLSVIPLPAALTSSTYSSNILALNPSGYWPLHEATPGVRGDVETNLGSLGNFGNAYYPDWSSSIANIVHSTPGALVGDNDPSVYFNNLPDTTSPGYVLIPRTAPATTLQAPMTLEAWVKPMDAGFGDIICEGAFGANSGAGSSRFGLRMSWGSGTVSGNNAEDFVFFISPGAAGTPQYPASTQQNNARTYPIGQWYHIALSTPDNTNWTFYVNGGVHFTFVLPMAPDVGDPLTIGQGLWENGGPQRAFPGPIDEVAIYTNVLDPSEIQKHYNIGAGLDNSETYKQAILETNPIIYLRMDALAYTPPAISTWPVATNYGTVPGNGVYSPGTMPGTVPGPNTAGVAGKNVMPGNGMSSLVDVGNNAAFNPTGATAFSYGAWFQGNPVDPRSFQTIMGRSDNSFRTAINSNGKLQAHAGGSDATSPAVLNDGLWHQFFITYTGTNTTFNSTNTGTVGINTLYVDGAQVAQTVGGANAGASALDMMIGDDPGNTNNPVGTGRSFAGQVCEAAFWNGVTLSSNQVLALFTASQIGPQITKQPVSGSVNAHAAFTNSVTVIGSTPLSYQWYRDNLPLPTGGQTNLLIGATNASLIISPVNASDASTDYYVIISNSGGSVTSSPVSLTVFTQPVFTNEPVLITLTNNILLFAGATPTFKVGTIGAVPTFYQWYTNGVADTNAGKGTSYVFSTASGATNFFCVASNFVGATTNTPVFVTVLSDPTAPYSVSVLAANPVGYWRLNEPDNGLGDHNAGAIANDYWGANNGTYTNTDLGQPGYNSTTDPTETSAQFGIDSFVDCDAFGIGGIDFSAPATNSVGFSVEAWVNGFQQSKDAGIASKGFGGGEQFDLDTGSDNVIQGGVTNQHCFRFIVRDASGANHNANSKILPNGAWHHLVGVCDEVNSNVTLYVDGVVAGSTSISPGSGILSSSRLMLIGARPSSSTVTSNDLQFVGTIDDVAVYNYALSANEVAAQYSSAGVPPNLSQAPATNVTANGFGTLTLAAAAVGTPSIGYTWTDVGSNAVIASGSSNEVPLNATLNISNVPPAWNGDTLELTVTNFYGTTNYLITLTVFTNAPVFTLDLPPQVQVVSGKSYNYSVTAFGALPFFFQWYNGATLLNNQTNSTLSVVAGSPGSTIYSVVASNAFGATTSTISTFTSIAQVNGYAYASNVLSLNAVGYWPLQETNSPAPVTIETNYGSLGALGTAYYVINTNASSQVTFGQGGALTGSGDNDAAVAFAGGGSTGYALVPRASPSLTLNPPFTIECWADPPAFDTFGDIVGNRGTSLNSSAGGVSSGVCVFWEHSPSQFAAFVGIGSGQRELRQSATPTESQWHHLVLTCDASDNFVLYVDGVADGSTNLPGYVPSSWNPLTIGAGFWDFTQSSSPFRTFQGSVDEVAVYSNVLSATEINNHYLSGITPGSNYVQAVQFDQPQLYYRMDCPGFTNTPETECPEAVNYGSAAPNGFYLSGVPPGGLAGPTNGILGSNVVAAPINGVFSSVDAGSDPSFNPSGTAPFTAVTWFRSYPADSRFQTIMSHGVTNWSMNLVGTNGTVTWNVSSASQVASTAILNDGNWHFAAGVYDGTNSYLYVDGQLNASARVTNSISSEPNAHLYLGGNSDLALVGKTQEYFAGALAQAAFFTSALSAAQIQSLYVATIAPTNPNTNATITKVFLSGTNVVVLGTNNNVPNTSFHYAVLTSTNVATPLSNWIFIVTNGSFNPDGTFNYTNPIIPGTPRQFIDVKAVP